MDKQVSLAAGALRAGGVALLPTDTVYGLAVVPTHLEAIHRLFALKGRPAGRNLPVMVAAPADLGALGVDVTAHARAILASRFVPGPVTVALGFLPGGPRPGWLDGREEVAIRIPDDRLMLAILRETGPLLVTSANLHGHDTPETVPEILAMLGARPDAVIDDGPRKTIPSTLVNCRLSPPVVEREGCVPFDEIARLTECTR